MPSTAYAQLHQGYIAAKLEHCLARDFDQLVDVPLDVADKLPQASPTTICSSIDSSSSASGSSSSEALSVLLGCALLFPGPHRGPPRSGTLWAGLWRPPETNFMCTKFQKSIAFLDSCVLPNTGKIGHTHTPTFPHGKNWRWIRQVIVPGSGPEISTSYLFYHLLISSDYQWCLHFVPFLRFFIS